MNIFHASFSMLDRATHHFRHSYARAISAWHCMRTRQAHHIYIRIYGKKSGGKIPVGQGNTWPRKRGRHELGERVGRRWSGGEEEWGSEEVPERREEESREKRNCRALKSPKRQGALTKSNTNERTNERTKSYSQGIVCEEETMLRGGGYKGKEVVWSRAERSRSRHLSHWPVERGGKLWIHYGIHARIYNANTQVVDLVHDDVHTCKMHTCTDIAVQIDRQTIKKSALCLLVLVTTVYLCTYTACTRLTTFAISCLREVDRGDYSTWSRGYAWPHVLAIGIPAISCTKEQLSFVISTFASILWESNSRILHRQ